MSDLENLLADLLVETRALRREIRQLRAGELVARLTQAERQAIALEILDRLDERFVAERRAASEQPPRRAQPSGRRPFFRE